ncbi:inositol monophosphatase [Thalassobius sp. Cn5-15]|uniref:inositol monophosphatase family protein n=1 Tax=Thalassobius sp. Cn5-15 TaxID=2917763 RepID=UPI001EF264A5|nr:inositol monophosphatase [Thalassobius sp. Cn5-15]MCG7493374.1 inositol monophosphatase [Thalassobius sp. Cn5-15]
MTLTQAQQDLLIDTVRAAAKAEILPRFRNLAASDIRAKTKPDDLVTEADLAAEARITAAVHDAFPDAMVLGEEAASLDPTLRTQAAEADLALIIDPVDGTWNFANGLATFGVILAATRYGIPVFGLLYDVVMDDWVLAAGNGAVMAAPDQSARALSTASVKPLDQLTGFIHLDLMEKSVQEQMAATLPRFNRTFMLRCSCHEYRLLAQGAVDFCLSGMLNPWDHAAGVHAVAQAGGVARLIDGRAYHTGITTGYLLTASSEEVWQKVAAELPFLH